ncbi:hypothetical protein CK203_086910 [Vitis vinifera]|uniref:Uncharacterized protein n=1 Tax=Vitis vinifera TaxID=29760 RepID=A0A438EAF4_VITVI|nr:hypothetical protein CK203_086910 [Vitis vinifera]
MGEPSPLGNSLGKRGSACVEVMTTLHGNTSSPWRCAEGCVPSDDTIASARDPLTHLFYLIEPPQPLPPCFRLDLHCSYHQGLGHDTDHCNALRHVIQDLIDQVLVNLGQLSVTTNPLPAHSIHAMPSPLGNIHHIDLIEDDSIHVLSWDDGLPDPIVLHDSCEDTFVSFTLWLDDDDSDGRDIQIVTRSGRIA